MFASNQNNTLCMCRHVITENVAAWLVKIYLHLESTNMATNEGTLVGLEKEKQFQFNYRKRINGFKLIRRGSKHQAIVKKDVIKKIQPFDPNIYERLMKREISEWDIKYDFWYSSEDRGNILPHLGIAISYFASLKAIYPCRHLRDHHMDYRWWAETFFPKKIPHVSD